MNYKKIKNINKNNKIYIFDEDTYEYRNEAFTGDSDYINVPENSTFVEPPQNMFKKDYIIVWNPDTSQWSNIPEFLYVLDDYNFAEYVLRNPITEFEVTLIKNKEVVSKPLQILPRTDLRHYFWDKENKEWLHREMPQREFVRAVFNQKSKEWEEGATKEEYNKFIDGITYISIKDWCSNQKKCEEYYLNVGIQNNKDPEYLNYVENRNKIISEQKKLKKE